MVDTRTVLLDQNHWIYLAKAYWGRPHKPAHAVLPELLAAAVSSGAVRLPLNFMHLVELLKAEKPERRIRLAEVFDLFSAGWYVCTWSYALSFEVARAVAIALEREPTPPSPTIIGRGHLYGMSPAERLRFSSQLEPGTLEKLERLASLPGTILDLIASSTEANRNHQKSAITSRAASDAALVEQTRRDLRSQSGDIRRRVKYANYTLHLQDQLTAAIAQHGLSLRGFCSRGVTFLTSFWSTIPSVDVDCELTLYRDRQWSRPVDPNDFVDLGHLVLGIPYCSDVVTENFWARAIKETGLATKYKTAIHTDLAQLRDVLAM